MLLLLLQIPYNLPCNSDEIVWALRALLPSDLFNWSLTVDEVAKQYQFIKAALASGHICLHARWIVLPWTRVQIEQFFLFFFKLLTHHNGWCVAQIHTPLHTFTCIWPVASANFHPVICLNQTQMLQTKTLRQKIKTRFIRALVSIFRGWGVTLCLNANTGAWRGEKNLTGCRGAKPRSLRQARATLEWTGFITRVTWDRHRQGW